MANSNPTEEERPGDEPAHPCSSPIQYWGLSKRELFAAMAMQGVYASSGAWPSRSDAPCVAEIAVATADALLKELAK